MEAFSKRDRRNMLRGQYNDTNDGRDAIVAQLQPQRGQRAAYDLDFQALIGLTCVPGGGIIGIMGVIMMTQYL